MDQLLSLSWWFSFFGTAVPWWLFCVLTSMAALPLCLRLFRGLADKGAGLSIGVGLIVTVYLAWLLSLDSVLGDRRAAFIRLLLLAGGCFLISLGGLFRARGYARGLGGLSIFAPAGVLIFVGLIALPHGAFSIYVSLLLLALGSIGCWLHDLPGLKKRLRQVAVPFLVGQFIFLIAFLFFANVRSYLPWATFELSLYQAEKWGNYTHLNSSLNSSAMPPADIWFNEQPINYYYGGHLMMATIAKASGTPARIAFNLGLATVFGLTMSMGFSFILSLAHLTTRKIRLGPMTWHSGLAWGFFGMLAIGMFGNLDPWRQLFTRDLDHGVKTRYIRDQERRAEEWKLDTGIPVPMMNRLEVAAATAQEADKVRVVLEEIEALREESAGLAEELRAAASAIDQRVQSLETGATDRQKQNAIVAAALSTEAKQLLRNQNARNAIDTQERIYRLITENKFGEAAEVFSELANAHQPSTVVLDAIETAIRLQMEVGMQSEALSELERVVWEVAPDDLLQSTFKIQPALLKLKLRQADEEGSYAAAITSLTEMVKGAAGAGEKTGAAAELVALANRAHEDLRINVSGLLRDFFTEPPPDLNQNPTIRDIRFSRANMAYVNFWDSSRAIKGTPPGVKEAGTITEFPYFSAILGDLHPHHMAIPFCLAALCACLSLLRKNSRMKSSDAVFFRRSWPDILAMAFFIGAVFPVNIWDAVVLAPLYAIVIIVAWKDVQPCKAWRWVGFAGFTVLLTFAVGILFNSMPDTTPLFQSFKFFLLAVLVLAAGIPFLRYFLPHFPSWQTTVLCIAVSVLLIALGAFVAPGKGDGGTPGLTIALRDVFFFAIFAGLAALWTLRLPTPAIGNWWYGAGGVYALVGGLSLIVILPFKLWFQSPLQPEKEILFDLMPPILSTELTGAANRFWATFWQASPINPFPQNLRTDFRDFFMHWGIFLVPIVFLAIGRFFRAAKNQAPGFPFMIAMSVLAITVFTRNYLGYWVGAYSLGLAVLCLYYAFRFRRNAEGPVWAFLAVAFFWTWFVEALHFNDDYAGNYERYNTPFKIYYPIWAIFAGGMVVAVREIFGRFRFRQRDHQDLLFSTELWTFIALVGVLVPVVMLFFFPAAIAKAWFFIFMVLAAIAVLVFIYSGGPATGYTFANKLAHGVDRLLFRWQAAAAALLICFVGMYYPYAATMTRTRDFFTWPMVDTGDANAPNRQLFLHRTLDALHHLGEYPKYRQDFKAITWLEENTESGEKLLERVDDVAYSHVGRMSTGSGRPTVLGWKHHQHQWRGRSKSPSRDLKRWYYENVEVLTDLETLFRRISNGQKKDFDLEFQRALFTATEQERKLMLDNLYDALSTEQLDQMHNAVENADGLTDLTPIIERFTGKLEEPLSEQIQRSLRLADKQQRLDFLREMFPDLKLVEYYQLVREIDKNDISMTTIMDRMMRDAKEVYLTWDEARAAEILDFYDIDYIVLGQLERQLYNDSADNAVKASYKTLDEKFAAWGLEVLYDSSAEQYGDDTKDIKEPTLVYAVPADFGGGEQ